MSDDNRPDTLAQTIREFLEGDGYEVRRMSDGMLSAVPMDNRTPLDALDELLRLLEQRSQECDEWRCERLIDYAEAVRARERVRELEAALSRVREKARSALATAAAPDYDEEAIRCALWATVDEALQGMA